MTELLYLKDSYIRECESKVTKAEGASVVLEQTCFYPKGGGQPTDTGTLQKGSETFKVTGVEKRDGQVWHVLEREGLVAGDAVKCTLDWERRYAHMRMHTSAHVLMAAIVSNAADSGIRITGNQLGAEQSRMDFDYPDYSPEKFAQIEQKANELLAKNLDVTVSFMPKEEALADDKLFRLKRDGTDPKEAAFIQSLPSEIRLVTIGDADRQADGGTHVKNTREVGRIKVVKTKNQGKQNRRAYWVLENG